MATPLVHNPPHLSTVHTPKPSTPLPCPSVCWDTHTPCPSACWETPPPAKVLAGNDRPPCENITFTSRSLINCLMYHSGKIVSQRQKKAVDLKRRTDRASAMSDSEIAELRHDIKVKK